jgi:hypothetical protein
MLRIPVDLDNHESQLFGGDFACVVIRPGFVPEFFLLRSDFFDFQLTASWLLLQYIDQV